MLVKDVMTKKVLTVTPDTSFSEAMGILRKNKIRRLPVVENGKLVGIVTEKDLLYASPSAATTLDIWELQYLLNKLKVEEIMTRNVITINEDRPVEEAARIIAEKKIGALPVLNESEELVGIVTETDIFKVFVKMLGAKRPGIRYTFDVEKDKPGIIFELSRRINQAGGNIVAISSYPMEDEKYIVVIKVQNINHDAFVNSLNEEIGAKLLYFNEC